MPTPKETAQSNLRTAILYAENGQFKIALRRIELARIELVGLADRQRRKAYRKALNGGCTAQEFQAISFA